MLSILRLIFLFKNIMLNILFSKINNCISFYLYFMSYAAYISVKIKKLGFILYIYLNM